MEKYKVNVSYCYKQCVYVSVYIVCERSHTRVCVYSLLIIFQPYHRYGEIYCIRNVSFFLLSFFLLSNLQNTVSPLFLNRMT